MSQHPTNSPSEEKAGNLVKKFKLGEWCAEDRACIEILIFGCRDFKQNKSSLDHGSMSSYLAHLSISYCKRWKGGRI